MIHDSVKVQGKKGGKSPTQEIIAKYSNPSNLAIWVGPTLMLYLFYIVLRDMKESHHQKW